MWFLHAKQRLLDQNYKSLWVPDLTCRFVLGNSVISTRNTSLHGFPVLICGLTNLYWFQTSPVALCMQNIVISTRITSLYGSQTSPVVLWMQNSVICTRMTSLYVFHHSSVFFCMQNSDFRTRLISLYESQTSSVVLSTHNSMLITRIKSLYWFQPSPVVFACKTATFGPELQVSIGPRPHLWFCACKRAR